jgi:ATP-binding protein involved in chromosome partitioning
MKIALPTENGLLAGHFGHAPQFTLVDVDDTSRAVQSTAVEDAPPHEHGLLPRWLRDRGVTTVIAGGIGAGAQNLLAEFGIELTAGAATREIGVVVSDYLAGRLETGSVSCHHNH